MLGALHRSVRAAATATAAVGRSAIRAALRAHQTAVAAANTAVSRRALSTAAVTPLPFTPLKRAFAPHPKVLGPQLGAPESAHNVYDSFSAAVGNTSLIRLHGPSALTGCNIYGKAEFENPGGSVKDRAALYLVKDAEEKGILTPGAPDQLIIEGTAGNTGIGLAMMGNSRGYRTIIAIADTQSKEKKDTLRWSGAELVEVPAVPFKNPNNYVHIAERLAKKLMAERAAAGLKGGVLYANQWDNLANRRAHIESTGPEIWAQTKGKIDAFSCAMGTGGSLTGIGHYLKSRNSAIKVCLTDPCGGAIYRYHTEGALRAVGDSISEGVGQGRLTGNMAGFKPDMAFEIPDVEALPVMYDLLEHEGLCVGSSTAINVVGAMRVAKALGPGHTVVTILADYGTRYASRIYNPSFLRSRNLPVPRWLDDRAKPSNAELLKRVKECTVAVPSPGAPAPK